MIGGGWIGGSFVQGVGGFRYPTDMIFGIDPRDPACVPGTGEAYNVANNTVVTDLQSKYNSGSGTWVFNGSPFPRGTPLRMLPIGANPRTVTVTFKWDGVVPWYDPGVALLGLGDNASTLRFGVWLTAGRIGIETVGNIRQVDMPRGSTAWIHFAAVLPPGASTLAEMLMYTDGVLGANASGNGGINTREDAYLFIGGLANLGYYPFFGEVMRITVADRALSEAEIQADFSAVRSRMGF